MFLYNDNLHFRKYNRVMPLFGDESLYFCQSITNNKNNIILDLGVGSGILSLASLNGSSKATGVDLNPKAVRYAEDNALLNCVEEQCTFLHGDLYNPVQGKQFGLIVSNPPFVPIPFGYKMFLSADGGMDGLAIIRRILKDVNQYLTEDGRFMMICMSLGTKDEAEVFKLLRNTFSSKSVRITTTHIYEDICIEAGPFFQLFEKVNTYNEWREFLLQRNLTHLYYTLNTVEPALKFEHIEQRNTIPLEQSDFSGSWVGRLNRFKTWFERKSERKIDAEDSCEIQRILIPTQQDKNEILLHSSSL